VGSQDETDLHNFGDWLSGWQILWLKLNPFTTLPKIPSQADIQLRLAYVSCVRQLEEVKTASYCDYIRPPIDKYGILQFEAFEEIRDVGYFHGKTYFAGLRKAGQLGWITSDKSSRRGSLENLTLEKPVTGLHGNYARFTDLAEMVCRVRENTPDDRRMMPYLNDHSDGEYYEDEYGDEYGSETEPDDSDLLTDPDDDDCYIDDDDLESGFNSTGNDLLYNSSRISGREGNEDLASSSIEHQLPDVDIENSATIFLPGLKEPASSVGGDLQAGASVDPLLEEQDTGQQDEEKKET